MAMEVNGRWMLVDIDKTNNKHQQFPVVLHGDVDDFQTLINQIHN